MKGERVEKRGEDEGRGRIRRKVVALGKGKMVTGIGKGKREWVRVWGTSIQCTP